MSTNRPDCLGRPPRRTAGCGFSLLEVALAAVLIAGTLVPAAAVLREAMQLSREASRRELLAILAVRATEEQQARTMRSWSSATETGNFSADGYPAIRYIVERSDNPADNGIVNRLMQIKTTVYDDENGDLALTAGEVQVVVRTKVAKLISYENQPL